MKTLQKYKPFAFLLLIILSALLLFAAISDVTDTLAQTIQTNGQGSAERFTESEAWITYYDGSGETPKKIANFSFGDEQGYQSKLSAYSGHVVDNITYSYALNWRPNNFGSRLQLCGMRVAFRLPKDGGFDTTNFNYINIAGSAIRPRNKTSVYRSDPSGNCIYLAGGNPSDVFNIHLNIPDGVRIDYLRAFYNHPTLNLKDGVYLPLILN